MPINAYTDINAVCDVLKTWLRQLPEAVFPANLYLPAMEAGGVLVRMKKEKSTQVVPSDQGP
jgi:hypothetical protein